MIICKICNKNIADNNAFGRHLNSRHKISSEQYILKYTYKGKNPVCECGCNKKTNFVKQGIFDFQKRLRGHKTPEERKRIAEKVKQTCLEKYGVTSTLLEKTTQQKIKNTIQQKYGNIQNVSQSNIVQETKRQNNLEKYGVTNPNKLESVKQKIRETCLEKYGVDNYCKTQKAKDFLSCVNKISFEDILLICKQKQYEPLFGYGEYEGCRKNLPFRCMKHNIIFKSQIFNLKQHKNQCPNCAGYNSSCAEQEIEKYLKSFNVINIITNSRFIISPQELDIYVPDKQFAIEFNGLYWHSEQQIGKNKHLNKFLKCQERGIKLIQFFEDDWRDKQDICKNIIKSSIGIVEIKEHARKLEIKEDIDKKELDNFLIQNHLQGKCKYNKSFGLYKKGELIQCITLRKPFTKKDDCLEIARLCTKCNILVRGGFSKLLKKVIEYCKENNYKRLITYSDCMLGSGNVYRKNGFNFIKHIKYNYYYTNFKNKFNRFKFRAQKGLTENQVADKNNVHKIYGAGNYLWEMNIL